MKVKARRINLLGLISLTSVAVTITSNALAQPLELTAAQQDSIPPITQPPPISSAPTEEIRVQTQSQSTVGQTQVTVGQLPSLRTQPENPNDPLFIPQTEPARDRLQPAAGLPAQGVSPNVTIVTPSAYGQTFGDIGFGVGFQSRTRFTNDADGSFGLGIGLGDPEQAIGVDVGITSVSTIRRSPFTAGTISLKLNRNLPEDFVIAVGIQGLATWGITDAGSSVYGVVTKQFRLNENPNASFSRLYLSVGTGGGQFRSESDVQNGVGSVGVFGSAALRIANPVNAIVEWTGQDLTLGFSITPFSDLPLVITPAITDVTGNAGNGTRFILGIGYGLSF